MRPQPCPQSVRATATRRVLAPAVGVRPRMQRTTAIARIARQLSELVGGHTETLEDGIDRYRSIRVNEHHLRPSTIVEYERQLDRLVASLGAIPIGHIQPEDVQAHLEGVSPGVLPSHFSVLGAAFRWLDRHGHPGLASSLPERRPRRRGRTEHLTDEEYHQLWLGFDEAQRSHWAWRRVIDALRLMTLVPLRRGEAASLAWSEIDAVGRRILLFEAKTGDRVLPCGARAIAVLEAQPRRSRYVFPGRLGRGHIHDTSLHHAWSRILQRTGLRHLTLHALRHSWASRAARHGVPLEIIRRVLGHSTEWMTARYAHIGASAARGAVESMERAIAGSWQCALPFGGRHG